MAKFTFVPYSIRIRKKREEQYLRLGIKDPANNGHLIDTEAVNFLSVFQNFLDCLPKASGDQEIEVPFRHHEVDDNTIDDDDNGREEERDLEGEEEERIILIEQYSTEPETKEIKGIFFAGDIEESSKVYNPVSNTPVYTINRGLARARPFYFRVKVSEFSDKGILILQTFKKYGIRDVFNKEFSNYLREKHDNLLVEINPFVPKDLIEYYLSQRVVEVQLIKFGFPAELMEKPMDAIPQEEPEIITKGRADENNCLEEEEKPIGKSIMLFKPPRGLNFPSAWIEKLKGNARKLTYDSDGEIRNLVEIKNFEYDNVKIKVQVGKNKRTINLAKKDKLRYNEELDKQLTIDEKTGHPTFESIDSVGRSFATGCAEEVWGGQLNVQILEEA